MIVGPGDIVRYREPGSEDWVYGLVLGQNADGSIQLASRQAAPRGAQLREVLTPADLVRMEVERKPS